MTVGMFASAFSNMAPIAGRALNAVIVSATQGALSLNFETLSTKGLVAALLEADGAAGILMAELWLIIPIAAAIGGVAYAFYKIQ